MFYRGDRRPNFEFLDNKPDDEGGIQIPIDADETEFQKDGSESQRSKRKDIIEAVLSEQQHKIVPTSEPKTTAISAENTAKTAEVTNANEEGKIQKEMEVENVVSEKIKCTTEPDQKVVCDGVCETQNQTESNSADAVVNEALEEEETNSHEIKPQETPVQQNGSDEQAEIAQEIQENSCANVVGNKSKDVQTGESDGDSQKEGQTNNSENSYTTEEEAPKDQPSKPEKRYICY